NAIDLTYDSLNDELERIDAATDGVGKKIQLTPKNLVVGTGLRREGVEIIKSMLVPSDANNAINAIKDQYSLGLIVSAQISDAE
ncbi:unnamed protein product, partial [marine sediment metagenome]